MYRKKVLELLLLTCSSFALGACASPYYDPVPPVEVQPQVTHYDSPLTMEDSYLRLYVRLRECVPGFYHVQLRFNASRAKASVMEVAGLGLNRYSFIGNSFRARFDVYPSGAGSRVEIISVDSGLRTLVTASQNWRVGDWQGGG